MADHPSLQSWPASAAVSKLVSTKMLRIVNPIECITLSSTPADAPEMLNCDTKRSAMIRILLAEDEEAMRTYLARALQNAGYDVVAVDRGTAALPLLMDGHFDLLLSDIVMPEMDGIELAQRCAEVSPKTKVMFITGFAAVTLKASREAPQAKVLSKPFHLKDLVMEVERIFGQQAQASI
jgi:two-component system, cell cycle response regulator CpdR